MPGTTPNQNYPYPLDADLIDVAGDIEDLAKAVDLDVNAVEAVAASKVSKSGDTMTGMLSLPTTAPTSLNHAITKGWADSTYVNDAGDSMTGPLDMTNHKITGLPNPTADSDAARKAYVDQSMTDAIRKSVEGPGNQTMQSGLTALRFTMTDPDAPSGPNQAAPKRYVDEKIAAIDASNYVQVDGDTMTGRLTWGVNPELNDPGAHQNVNGTYRSTVDSGNLTVANLALGRKGNSNFVEGTRWIAFQVNVDQPVGSIKKGAGLTVVYDEGSDMRLKERLAPITDAARRAQQLARLAFRGRWRDDPNGKEFDMLSAQDISTVAPYATSGNPEGYTPSGAIDPMMVDYGKLVPLLFSALGNALDRIDQLEARLA
jgi:hypothetical protein